MTERDHSGDHFGDHSRDHARAPARTACGLRDARSEDIPAIAALYADAVREDASNYELEPPDAGEMARRWQAIASQRLPYLVAVVEERIVGFGYAGSYRTRAGYRWTVEHAVYVARGMQRRGVGAHLLAALIDACATLGFRQMIAVIGDRENAASIALHAKFGFRTVGVFEGIGRKHGRWLDNVQMQRALGEGASSAPEP